MASLLSLTYLKPILLINTKDSLCAALEHSYQLLNCVGNSIGGKHGAGLPKKEHTHIINVNLVIDTCCKL